MAFHHVVRAFDRRRERVENVCRRAIQFHLYEDQQVAAQLLWRQDGGVAGNIALPRQSPHPFSGRRRGQIYPLGKLDIGQASLGLKRAENLAIKTIDFLAHLSTKLHLDSVCCGNLTEE